MGVGIRHDGENKGERKTTNEWDHDCNNLVCGRKLPG